ncbi:MAG: HEAT repeat domain-containing protein [Deltaproteobacteria bacterium]|nr:HEAT repeat domain-containing protein [Deltaproteobacteria bacterium]
MGHIPSKLALRWFVGLAVFAAIGYASIKYYRQSKVEPPTTTIQEKAEKASVIPTEVQLDATQETVQDPDSSWIEATTKALADPNVSARVQAILSLRKHPSSEAINLLLKFLDDNDGVVVSEAIDTLGYIGLNSDLGDLVYEMLEKRARDKAFALRGHALITAAMIGKDRLLPVVSDFMFEQTDSGKGFAVRSLSLIGSPACVPHLGILLDQSEDSEIRRNCFNILANINTPEALDLLQEYVVSSNDRDQAASALALSRLNMPELNEMLANKIQNQELEKDAIQALASSPAAPDIFGDLLQREEVENEQKASCLKTLAKYSSSHGPSERRTSLKEAVEPLLYSPDSTVEKEAIRAIAGIGGVGTDEALIPKLESKDPEVRKETAFSLIGYVTPKNYKALLDVLWDDDQETRRIALMCVEQFVDGSDRETLEKARDHEDELISKHAGMLLDQVLRK